MKVIVALRAKEKASTDPEKTSRAVARRLSKIKSSLEQMRSKMKRDLRSDDPNRFLTALAVAMLDETGHDAVDAKKKHIRFDEEEDSVSSSVMVKLQKGRGSRVANPMIVQALRNAYETIDDDNDDLFRHDVGQVTAASVTDYLTAFDLNAEKIRGYNANDRLQSALTEMRAKGSELPKHGRSKQKVLRTEFQQALSTTASAIGLDSEVFRSKYLMPGLEASYLKDGHFALKSASLQEFSRAFAVFCRSEALTSQPK